MSIKSVAKAVDLLHESLIDASISGAHLCSDPELHTPREEHMFMLAGFPELFESCPELTSLGVSVDIVDDACYAEPAFVFNFEEQGVAHTIEASSTDGHQILEAIQAIVDERCADALERHLAQRLEERRVRMDLMCRRYENHARREVARLPFWSRMIGKNSFTASRSDYEASLVKGVLDEDAFRARLGFDDASVPVRQMALSEAPAHWNKAVVATIADRLASGMDPDGIDDNGVTALVAAAVYGREADVDALLDAGADPNLADGNGMTPLTASVAAGNGDMVRLLTACGANPDGTRMVPSLLVAIAANEGDQMVRVLIDVGVNLHGIMPNGKSFYDTFSSYLNRANGLTRSEVTALVHSIETEKAVRGAFGGVGGAPFGKRKGMGMAL